MIGNYSPPDDGQLSAGEWKSMVAVFSATGRKGVWRPHRRIRVVSVFGGAGLDFREAKLLPG